MLENLFEFESDVFLDCELSSLFYLSYNDFSHSGNSANRGLDSSSGML